MTFNRQRWSWSFVVSGLGVIVFAAVAGLVCLRSDRERWSRPSPDAAIRTDVETATQTMRPLGSSDLMVDKNGTIWRGQHPVGVWGVNGGEAANAAKLR